MRLDKYIASQGKYSRTDVKKLIKNGAVAVSGTAAKDPGMQIDPERAEITVNGQAFDYKNKIYIMMNKPQGVISASEDKSRKTVVDLVPDGLKRSGLFPAGRLDADTTGFVLITDDGDFAHRILAPKSHIEKTYIAELAEPLSADVITVFEKGIALKDGYTCLSAKIREIAPRTAEVKICEGKYHQIKRMFAACGNKVNALRRTAMGGLELDKTLLPGECREITASELELLTENGNVKT